MKTVRFGVVGIGNMGFYHAGYLYDGEIENAALAAVCDISGERLNAAAERFPGVPRYASYREMVEKEALDALIVATPHYMHEEITVYALGRRLNVICEKPESVSVSAAARMNEAAEKSGKLFAVMFNQRTDPLFARARSLVRSGALGQKKRLTWIITNWYRTQAYYDSGRWRATWKGEGGGVLLNQAPHNLDLWQWIFGMPDKITALCSVGKYHNIEVEDDVRILASYECGASAEFITSTGEFPGTNRLEMIGDRAKIVLEEGKLKMWRLKVPEREFCFTSKEGFATIETEYSEYVPEREVEGHRAICENFVRSLLFGEELVSPGIEAINELTLSNASYLSAAEGRTIDLPFDHADFDRLLEKLVGSGADFRASAVSETADPARWKVRW